MEHETKQEIALLLFCFVFRFRFLHSPLASVNEGVIY